MLIDECLKAYAANLPSPNPYTTNLDLSILRHPTLPHLQGLRQTAHRYVQDRMEFVDLCTRRLELLKDEFRSVTKAPTFDEFLSRFGSAWAETLAERAGVLNECKAKGISRLLQVKTIRLAVGGASSLFYAKLFKERDLEEATLAKCTTWLQRPLLRCL